MAQPYSHSFNLFNSLKQWVIIKGDGAVEIWNKCCTKELNPEQCGVERKQYDRWKLQMLGDLKELSDTPRDPG